MGETVSVGLFGTTFSGTIVGSNADGFVVNTSGVGQVYFSAVSAPGFGSTVTIDGDPFAFCFLAGTMIGTPAGERAVETLVIGDLVSTADGDVRPVRWIGRQSVLTLFADPLRGRPVRIAAGALGEALPVRDLLVSPDHAMLVDGVLVHAGAMVNGTTVTRAADLPERFTYYHIELEDHALVLAEGAPAETFVDNVTRRRFDNYAEFEAVYGDGVPDIREMTYPRAMSPRQVPQRVRSLLAERAATLGHVIAAAA